MLKDIFGAPKKRPSGAETRTQRIQAGLKAVPFPSNLSERMPRRSIPIDVRSVLMADR
jgi:hypothetical protein